MLLVVGSGYLQYFTGGTRSLPLARGNRAPRDCGLWSVVEMFVITLTMRPWIWRTVHMLILSKLYHHRATERPFPTDCFVFLLEHMLTSLRDMAARVLSEATFCNRDQANLKTRCRLSRENPIVNPPYTELVLATCMQVRGSRALHTSFRIHGTQNSKSEIATQCDILWIGEGSQSLVRLRL